MAGETGVGIVQRRRPKDKGSILPLDGVRHRTPAPSRPGPIRHPGRRHSGAVLSDRFRSARFGLVWSGLVWSTLPRRVGYRVLAAPPEVLACGGVVTAAKAVGERGDGMRVMSWQGRRGRPHRRPVPFVGAAVLVAVGALLLAACSSSTASSATAPASTPAPKGFPAFYAVPRSLPTAPGVLLKDTPVTVAGVDGTTYRVMYTSEDEQGKVVPVTGLVFVPRSAPPAGGYKVVAWGHGTNGMADQCAPSLSPSQAVPSLNALLSEGWEVTASDYQGEGTPPGVLAYLVGNLAAENTIDLVRAVQHVGTFHASSDYVVWGHSEGGQTAMFAWHIGPTYAPSLHLLGVVAGAPPSQFQYIYAALQHSKYAFYLYMAAIGFNVAYGNTAAPLSAVTTPEARTLVPLVKKGCYNYLQTTFDKYPLASLVTHDPFTVPQWKVLLEENDPGAFTTPTTVPLLIIQGTADGQIPPISTQLLATHLCSIGAEVQRWMYPGEHHAQVIVPSTPDMVHWIADRFAGQAAPDPYVPHGLPDVLAQDCATPGGFTTPAP